MSMRDLSEFCDQLGEMQQCFSKLDNCERTIALYYLMVGLPYANARFLQRALEEAISKVITPESQNLERNANDPAFISSFLSDTPTVALSKMLAHIPLLHPGNKEALKGYIAALRRFLCDCAAPTFKIYNECVEILSYVFVHPAFSREDKKFFRHLLYYVVQPNFLKYFAQNSTEDICSGNNSESLSYLNNYTLENVRYNRRSNSLTSGQFSSRDILTSENWSSRDNTTPPFLKPRSYSLSSDKSLPLKVPSIHTSSSETRLQDLQVQNNSHTVKGVVCWLKSLRLHKYSWVFNNLSYDQMLNLTEPELEALGITKGARHKILLSIAKLKERGQKLTELETEIVNGGDVLSALKMLKAILQTPLQTTIGEDLPSQFVRVMGKVCTQLLMLRAPSDESLILFSTLCERAETSDAFTDDQKKKLGLWRRQMIRINQGLPHGHRVQSNNNYRNQSLQLPHRIAAVMGKSYPQSHSHKSSSYPNMQGSPVVGAHRHSLGSTTLQNQFFTLAQQYCPSSIPFSINDFQNSFISTNSNDNEKLHCVETTAHNTQSTDIESSLESLCLQMMEHALGP